MRKILTLCFLSALVCLKGWGQQTNNVFTESFEQANWNGAPTSPNAWSTNEQTNSNKSWHRNDVAGGWNSPNSGSPTLTGANGTSKYARFHSFGIPDDGTSASTSYFQTPFINTTTYSTSGSYYLSFWFINPSGSFTNNDKLFVYFSKDGNFSNNPDYVNTNNVNQWTQIFIPIPSQYYGTNFKIQFRAYGDPGSSDIGLDEVTVNALTNDNCTGAVAVTVDATAISGTNINATQQYSAQCSPPGFSANDVWYKFTAPTAGSYLISVNPSSDFDAVLNTYSACGSASYSIACADANGNGVAETIQTPTLAANAVYYYRIHGYKADAGSFTTAVNKVPANDDCVNATTLTVGGSVLGTTVAAMPTSPSLYNDVWYKFTACATDNSSTYITTSTTGQDLDIYVFSASCPSDLNSYFASGSNINNTTETTNNFSIIQNTTYYVRVRQYSGTAGSFTIKLNSSVASAPVIALNSGSSANQSVCNNTAVSSIQYTISNFSGTPTVTGLPNGVTGNVSGNTLTIAGTPNVTTTGPYNYVVSASNTCATTATTTASGTITVNPDATIALTSAAATTSQSVCSGVAISSITYTIGGGGTGAGVTGLPSGINGSYNAATKVFTISGSANVTTTTTYNYTVTTTGTCVQKTASGTIMVNPNATITLTSAAATTSQSVCSGVAITQIKYTIGGGGTGAGVTGLPDGITGVYSGGVFTISGSKVVTVATTYSYTVTTTGTCTQTSASGTITVNPDASITFTSGGTTNAQSVCSGVAITQIKYTIGGGGTGAILTGTPTLPAGITGSYNGSVFTISGSANVTTTTTYNYTVTTTGTCVQKTASGTITVNPNATIALTSAAATTSQSVCSGVAISSITYTIGGGGTGAGVTGLPSGINGSYNAATKVFTISGSASVTTTTTYNYTVTTTGSCTQTSATGTIIIKPNATLTLSSGTGTKTYCQSSAITSGNFITYTLTNATSAIVTGLPAGMSGTYNGGVFTIGGTPTAAGSFNYTVTATGDCPNPQVTATGTITINKLSDAAITSVSPICSGQQSTLTFSSMSGGTINFSPAAINGQTSVTIPAGGNSSLNTGSLTSSTIYTINSITGATCPNNGPSIASTTVAVNPLPTAMITAGAGYVQLGNTDQLTGSGGGTWSSSNTSVATVNTSGLVTAQTTGVTTITYTVTNATTTCSNTDTIMVNVTADYITQQNGNFSDKNTWKHGTPSGLANDQTIPVTNQHD